MRKLSHYVLIISIFLSILFSFLLLSKCFPMACDFNSICRSGDCADETLAQHLGERDFLGGIVIRFQKILVLFALFLGAFLIIKKYLSGINKYLGAYLQARYKLYYFLTLKWVDCLIFLFAKGVLHPKIF